MKAAPTYATRETMGNPPEMEWIPVAQMFVDKEYQRSTETGAGKALIEQIAQEFNWSKFQVVVVTRRADGMYAVIDGQHRRQGAIKCGLSSLPCIVVDTSTLAAEADIFVSVNSGRVGVQPYQMFWSKLAAGRPDAVAVKAVCDAAGVTIPRTLARGTHTGHKRLDLAPNETIAITAIAASIRLHGSVVTIDTLKTLVAAFPTKGGQIRQGIIKGLSLFRVKHLGQFNQVRLVQELSKHDTEVLERRAKESKTNHQGHLDRALAAQIAQVYGEQLLAVQKTVAVAGKFAPSPAVSIKRAPAPAQPPRPSTPHVPIMRGPAPNPTPVRSTSVVQALPKGVLTCGCKRQFRPERANQTRCNICLDKYHSAESYGAGE